MAVGTMQGTICLADTTTRATLCKYGVPSRNSSSSSSGSSSGAVTGQRKNSIAPLPVRHVQWFRNGQHILSMGDDAVVRIWKLGGPANTSVPDVSFAGYGDTIRCGALYQTPPPIRKPDDRRRHDHSTKTALQCCPPLPHRDDHTIRIWDMDHLEDGTDPSTNTTTTNVDRHKN